MPDRLIVTNEGPVRILRIQRPEVRNAVDSKLAKAMREAWIAFDKDPEAKVGILTGGEEVFCAGADLADLAGLAAEIEGDNGPLGFSRLSVSKPTLAAVAGYCVGGGLELACWCDLRIADTTAVFGCFERRFGVPLVDGGTQRLPRIVGLGRALDIILTGRPVPAEEARAMGLVNELVPPGQALRRALEIAQQIAAFPQLCVKSDRQAVYEGLGNRLEKGLRIEARLGAEVIRSGEPAAGAKAFKKGKGRGGAFQ
ncbi:MAG TPA: crotonase/enoyl-CoA hydratase family protein [Thermoanaerobaculia bacterium]|nr:crotonase/enoyl-CoA hydratase family protein [Thermoanaerobaculia bacterium]